MTPLMADAEANSAFKAQDFSLGPGGFLGDLLGDDTHLLNDFLDHQTLSICQNDLLSLPQPTANDVETRKRLMEQDSDDEDEEAKAASGSGKEGKRSRTADPSQAARNKANREKARREKTNAR